ncbi:MAG: glycoside hydrolase family 3 C-terminal domain-containing protein [Elusimicrobia bacterium]|nr:glycoside hydrolase family 3 C-terminal domain-containing protein [Elusimicrobiota bacterium]
MPRRSGVLLCALAALAPTLAFAAPKATSTVESLLARLSVEEKVGQLFMIAIDTDIASRHEDRIRKGQLGGVLLRWDKFTGEETRAFSRAMRAWTDASPGKVPLFFAADHEGGAVFTQRRYGGTPFPGNMALGAAGSPALAEKAAFVAAEELRSIGVHIDFAPVVDVSNNPDNPIVGIRSFGEDPPSVAALGDAAVRGFLRGGVLPTIKHFPGHGNTAVDSHHDLPLIAAPLAQLEKDDLFPFRSALRIPAPIVMTAHIVLPELDPASPVTLSSAALDGYLRTRLAFKGVAISDSMDMGAITKTYGSAEASVRSLEAGCDVLLLGKGDYPASFERVLAAVREGRVSMERLDRSVRRILVAKRAAGLLGAKPRLPEEGPTAAKGGAALARRVAESALTLLSNEDGLLPLKLGKDKTLALFIARGGRSADDVKAFAEEVRARHPRVELVEFAPSISSSAVEALVAKAAGADVILFGSNHLEVSEHKGQTELYDRLRALGKPVIAASLMNPYDQRNFKDARTRVCVYGITPPGMSALARLLFGEIPPKGRLPVSIPGLFRRGEGLRQYKR